MTDWYRQEIQHRPGVRTLVVGGGGVGRAGRLVVGVRIEEQGKVNFIYTV